MAEVPVSFLDVVDSYLGATATHANVLRLSKREVLDLSGLLADFYDSWSPPSPSPALRLFLPRSRTLFGDWMPGMPIPRAPAIHLLYVDTLVVEDPVSTRIMRLTGRQGVTKPHWTLVQRALAASADAHRDLAPLIRDGSFILVPGEPDDPPIGSVAWQIDAALAGNWSVFEPTWQEQTADAEREIAEIAAHFGEVAPEDGGLDVGWSDQGTWLIRRVVATDGTAREFWRDAWLHSRGLIREMGTAAGAASHLLPTSVYEEATYRAILASLEASETPVASHDPVRTKESAALVSGLLPMLEEVPVRTLVKIRQDEQSFASWRAELRNAVRLIEELPNEPGFHQDAREAVRDMLLPRLEGLETMRSRAKRLRRGVREAAVGFGIGTVAAATSAAARGDARAAVAGLAGAGAASTAGLALRAMFPSRPTGSRAVLLRLLPHFRNDGFGA